jgi:hypothetical protein
MVESTKGTNRARARHTRTRRRATPARAVSPRLLALSTLLLVVACFVAGAHALNNRCDGVGGPAPAVDCELDDGWVDNPAWDTEECYALTCEQGDCCLRSCGGYNGCTGADEAVKENPETVTCPSTQQWGEAGATPNGNPRTCTDNDCCQRTCALYNSCEAGFHLKDDPGTVNCGFTLADTCNDSHCCEANPTCSVTNDACPVGYHFLNTSNPPQCATGVCDDTDCCGINQNCAQFDAVNSCGTLYHLIDSPAGTLCPQVSLVLCVFVIFLSCDCHVLSCFYIVMC